MPSENLLSDTVLQKILSNREKQISFYDFMMIALYDVQHGYYSRCNTASDYYTNVDVHQIYAQAFCFYFKKLLTLDHLFSPPFIIIELGAGEGKFADHCLSFLQQYDQYLYDHLTYYCIELSHERRNKIVQVQKKHPCLNIKDCFDFSDQSLENIIIFSNEFFDALPCYRVLYHDTCLYEVGVNANFQETRMKIHPRLKDYFSWLGISLKDGGYEINLLALEWMERLHKSMRHGYIITVDYGYLLRDKDNHSMDTVTCMYKNIANNHYYERIGLQDITSHVNFSALMKKSQEYNVQHQFCISQFQFITKYLLKFMIQQLEYEKNKIRKFRISSAIKTLIHPEGLGGAFKVLVQYIVR